MILARLFHRSTTHKLNQAWYLSTSLPRFGAVAQLSFGMLSLRLKRSNTRNGQRSTSPPTEIVPKPFPQTIPLSGNYIGRRLKLKLELIPIFSTLNGFCKDSGIRLIPNHQFRQPILSHMQIGSESATRATLSSHWVLILTEAHWKDGKTPSILRSIEPFLKVGGNNMTRLMPSTA